MVNPNKAKREPRFRFYDLYDRIQRLDVLMAAWDLVARSGAQAISQDGFVV